VDSVGFDVADFTDINKVALWAERRGPAWNRPVDRKTASVALNDRVTINHAMDVIIVVIGKTPDNAQLKNINLLIRNLKSCGIAHFVVRTSANSAGARPEEEIKQLLGISEIFPVENYLNRTQKRNDRTDKQALLIIDQIFAKAAHSREHHVHKSDNEYRKITMKNNITDSLNSADSKLRSVGQFAGGYGHIMLVVLVIIGVFVIKQMLDNPLIL